MPLRSKAQDRRRKKRYGWRARGAGERGCFKPGEGKMYLAVAPPLSRSPVQAEGELSWSRQPCLPVLCFAVQYSRHERKPQSTLADGQGGWTDSETLPMTCDLLGPWGGQARSEGAPPKPQAEVGSSPYPRSFHHLIFSLCLTQRRALDIVQPRLGSSIPPRGPRQAGYARL